MNPVDAVINFFNPVAGNVRVKARAATAAVMNYDGASRGRRTYGWKAPGTAADASGYGGGRIQLRNLSRDFVRNRALAMRAREVIIGAVVGSGIMPSINAPGMSARRKDQIKAVIEQHLLTKDIDALGENTLAMMQEIIMGAVITDGEVLARRRYRDPRFSPDLKLPFQVQLLEADYLNETITAWGQNMVFEGVEYGPTGRIEAYHLWDDHPGAIRRMGSVINSSRVSARDIIHVRRTDRPGQTRGVSWFAPVMMTLGEISDYQEAQILKQRMAALLAGVISTEEDATGANVADISELSPGALVKLPPGNTVNWTDPPKVDGYGEFMGEAIGMIAIGMGITRESLSGNLSGVNYSSGRMGHLVQDRNVQRWQQNLMIEQFCVGIEAWTLEAWRLMSTLPKPDFTLDWTAPRRPLIDPTKEIPAFIEAVDAGMTSMQRVQREQGLDPEVIRAERVQDIEKDKEAQLPARVPAIKPATVNVTQGG